MKSTNPVLTRHDSFSRSYSDAPMAIEDVVNRSGILLGLLVATGAVAWVLQVPLGIAALAGFAAFVVAMVAIFKKTTSPILFMTYAVLEGVLIGSFSRMYEGAYSGIVIQAVLGVVLVFGAMLLLYKTGIVKVTPMFAKVVVAAGFAAVALMLVNFGAGFFVEGGLGLRDGGPLAIGFSLFAIVLGALFYALDFNQVEALVEARAPQKESWRAAFGLTLTTVWLYLELLRLLSYFRN